MQLYLCEKPSQARDIARVLGLSGRGEGCIEGDTVTVTWAVLRAARMLKKDGHKDLNVLKQGIAKWTGKIKSKNR